MQRPTIIEYQKAGQAITPMHGNATSWTLIPSTPNTELADFGLSLRVLKHD